MLTKLQYNLLMWIAPATPGHLSGSAYSNKSKLRVLLGDALLEQLRGKVVIDFGCGDGNEAVEMASHGARKVIGIDIREPALVRARDRARQAGVDQVCQFALSAAEKADVVVSIDSFEHFEDPAGVLRVMHELLQPDGFVITSFGPTWYHPYGGHLFSVFPWAHLLFQERALIQWRANFRSDGAKRFSEVEGGLNQMTIRRFERIVRDSPFHLALLETVPIRSLRLLHNGLTREFATAIVRAKLTPR